MKAGTCVQTEGNISKVSSKCKTVESGNGAHGQVRTETNVQLPNPFKRKPSSTSNQPEKKRARVAPQANPFAVNQEQPPAEQRVPATTTEQPIPVPRFPQTHGLDEDVEMTLNHHHLSEDNESTGHDDQQAAIYQWNIPSNSGRQALRMQIRGSPSLPHSDEEEEDQQQSGGPSGYAEDDGGGSSTFSRSADDVDNGQPEPSRLKGKQRARHDFGYQGPERRTSKNAHAHTNASVSRAAKGRQRVYGTDPDDFADEEDGILLDII